MNRTWKENWQESRQHYLDWWRGKGLVISMWEHLDKDGHPHESVAPPAPARDWSQFWFNPQWRAKNIHYRLSRRKAGIAKAEVEVKGEVDLPKDRRNNADSIFP